MNRVFLSGNLTREPETRHIPASGSVVCNFGLAVNERWNDARTGEQRESVCFVEIEAWNRQAEIIAEYFKKGSQILIEGNLKFEQWQADDGTNRNRLKVRLQRFEFVGANPNGNGNPEPMNTEQPEDTVEPEPVTEQPGNNEQPNNTEPEPENTEQTSDPMPQDTATDDDDVPF